MNHAIRTRRQLTLPAFALAIVASATLAAAQGRTSSSPFLLTSEPEGALDVLAARKEIMDKQDVVIVGRIGGRPNPWIKQTAAFPIVDRSLKACSELEGDTCKTPWDYCCEPNLAQATVLVMLVDESGNVVKRDPRALLGVKELSTVVVQGKAKRDRAGNLTILATKIHVKKKL